MVLNGDEMKLDIEAIRREARGPGHEPVAVTRRWLAAVLEEIDHRPVLDHDRYAMAGRSRRD